MLLQTEQRSGVICSPGGLEGTGHAQYRAIAELM